MFEGRPKLAAWWAAVQADPEAGEAAAARASRHPACLHALHAPAGCQPSCTGSALRASRSAARTMASQPLLAPCNMIAPVARPSAPHHHSHTHTHCPCPAPAARVIAEMRNGLADWEAAKRWDNLGISAQVADGSFNWSCS